MPAYNLYGELLLSRWSYLTSKASVSSVMRSPPVAAAPSETVASVAEKMVMENIGAIIIMSGEVPVGIVTERDMVEKVLRWGKDPRMTSVRDIMSPNIVTIEADESVIEALRMMRDRKIRRLAVARDGELVGIVTERRLLDSLV